MSGGDSSPSRPGAPLEGEIMSAFEHTGFQASRGNKSAPGYIGFGLEIKTGEVVAYQGYLKPWEEMKSPTKTESL